MPDRVVEINYSQSEGLTLRFKPGSLSLVPEPAKEHFKAANKELLLALRSFVDKAIETMEPEAKGRGPRRVDVTDGADDSGEE
jgi:hypothetical protein